MTHNFDSSRIVLLNSSAGRLPKNNGVPWRGNSGLQDGSELSDVKGGLVGGYYDGGNNIKFHYPMAFSMTLLSWSAVEYGPKYEAIGEYDHVRDIIKWGVDYLLRTFNSSASTINKMYCQVSRCCFQVEFFSPSSLLHLLTLGGGCTKRFQQSG